MTNTGDSYRMTAENREVVVHRGYYDEQRDGYPVHLSIDDGVLTFSIKTDRAGVNYKFRQDERGLRLVDYNDWHIALRTGIFTSRSLNFLAGQCSHEVRFPKETEYEDKRMMEHAKSIRRMGLEEGIFQANMKENHRIYINENINMILEGISC